MAAVNSIDNGCNYTYALQTGNMVECEPNNLVHGFATEVCIGGTGNNECIIESDGNDICWNAILTEADLNELVDPVNYTDSVAQIIHPIDTSDMNGSQCRGTTTTTTTAQLTAVEPHDLETITTNGGGGGGSVLDDHQQLFYQTNQLHDIGYETHSTNDHVITSTSNVVTCINDTSIGTHWSTWNPYQTTETMRIDCQSHNDELILSQIDHSPEHHHQHHHHVNTIGNNTGLAYLADATQLIPQLNSNKQHNLVHSIVVESVVPVIGPGTSDPSHSPTSYETTNSLQPWVECKTTLQDAALDLDSFGNIEQHF